jgi:hypothetical protein
MNRSLAQAVSWGISGWRRRQVPRRVGQSVELLILAGGILVLPILPFFAALIAGDGRFLVQYFKSISRIFFHIRALHRSHAIERFVVIGRHAHMGPKPVGTCTHCGNCCLDRRCVFLQFDGGGQSSCQIYGGAVWKALACAEYPKSQVDIELYQCPSFRPAFSPRRTIPIVAVKVPPKEEMRG